MNLFNIDIEKLKNILIEYGVVDSLTKTPISEIFKNSNDFEVKLLEKIENISFNEVYGENVIKFTFVWQKFLESDNPDFSYRKYQTWYIDMDEYKGVKRRMLIFEKFNGN